MALARVVALLVAAGLAASCAARPVPQPQPQSRPRPAVPASASPASPTRLPAEAGTGPGSGGAPADRLKAAKPPAPVTGAPTLSKPVPKVPARLPLRVGLLFPSRGRYRGFGSEARRGAELCLAAAAGERGLGLEPVFVEETEGADAAAIFAGFDKGREIVAIIGPLLSGTAERLLPAAARRSLPVISPTAASTGLGEQSPVFFRTCMTMESFADALAGLAAARLGRPAFAVLAPAQKYGRSFAAAFGRALQAHGGSVALVREYEPGLRDLVPWAEALKSDLRSADGRAAGAWGVDALFLAGSAQEAGMILPRLAYQGLDPRAVAVVGGSALNAAEFPRLAGGYAEGALIADGFFAGSDLPAAQTFARNYRALHGEDPGAAAAQGCAAAQVLAAALEGGAASPREVLAALGALGELPSAVGPLRLFPGGKTVRQPFFTTVRGSALVEIR